MDIFKKANLENFENAKFKRTYLSFHCSEKLNISLTDNLLTNFNNLALELMIKKHGEYAQEEGRNNFYAKNSEKFELKKLASKDWRVLCFAVENKFEKKKLFEINISCQIMFTFTHNRISCYLERGENKFLMCLLAKKFINKNEDNKLLINLGSSDNKDKV